MECLHPEAFATHQRCSVLRIKDDGGNKPLSLRIGQESGKSTFIDPDKGISGSEVDASNHLEVMLITGMKEVEQRFTGIKRIKGMMRKS
jgi:hypothetical protein